MKIAIIGNGGREHAIANAISKSDKITSLYCIPGNGGTSQIAENVNINITKFSEIYKFIIKLEIDIVIVGPEKPLVDGLVDYLEEKKIKVFGPNKNVSQLEGSKIFTKKICEKYNIPTAKFGIFKNKKEAYKFLDNSKFPIVVKADGLAAGKGVYICEELEKAKSSVDEIFDGKFGEARNILIEEFLTGDEMSYFIISDGKTYKTFNTAQDHKRVGIGDTGKNTGGMGAYSPSGLINKDLEIKIIKRIIEPTLKALKDRNDLYKGFLYAGLMIKNNNPYLIEYNVRMGDPECQTILPLLKTDFLEIVSSCCNQKLAKQSIEWDKKKSMCIVLCSKGYPDKFEKKVEIKNLSKIVPDSDEYIFHAGTYVKNNKFFSDGGRVLNFVSISSSFSSCRNNALNKINKLNWPNGYYRSDIGYKVIK